MRVLIRPTAHVFVSLGPVALLLLSPFIVVYLLVAAAASIALTVWVTARWLVHGLAWCITYVGTWRRNRRYGRQLAAYSAIRGCYPGDFLDRR